MQVYPEGTHFMVPWFERPIIYDVRAQPNIVQSTSGSRDLQMVRAATARAVCERAAAQRRSAGGTHPAWHRVARRVTFLGFHLTTRLGRR